MPISTQQSLAKLKRPVVYFKSKRQWTWSGSQIGHSNLHANTRASICQASSRSHPMRPACREPIISVGRVFLSSGRLRSCIPVHDLLLGWADHGIRVPFTRFFPLSFGPALFPLGCFAHLHELAVHVLPCRLYIPVRLPEQLTGSSDGLPSVQPYLVLFGLLYAARITDICSFDFCFLFKITVLWPFFVVFSRFLTCDCLMKLLVLVVP